MKGEPVEAGDRKWNYEAAKAIYLNLVSVPRWILTNALLKAPGWLINHVSQSTAVGLVQADGGICWLGYDSETGLSYHADLGVVINRKRVRLAAQEKFDESYD